MAQQMLQQRVSAGVKPCCSRRVLAKRARTAVIVRAEGRVVREYREDGDQIINTAAQQAPKELYVQNASLPKQQGLSKEYKQKLRQEYVGLGGAEGQAMSQNWFLIMITVVGVLAVSCKLIGAI